MGQGYIVGRRFLPRVGKDYTRDMREYNGLNVTVSLISWTPGTALYVNQTVVLKNAINMLAGSSLGILLALLTF